jgi:hypothetical protein
VRLCELALPGRLREMLLAADLPPDLGAPAAVPVLGPVLVLAAVADCGLAGPAWAGWSAAAAEEAGCVALVAGALALPASVSAVVGRVLAVPAVRRPLAAGVVASLSVAGVAAVPVVPTLVHAEAERLLAVPAVAEAAVAVFGAVVAVATDRKLWVPVVAARLC